MKDRVALVLAGALVLSVVGIFVAVVFNIITNHQPAATLGENTTQVLAGLIGGIIGVLGSYLGKRE